MILALMIVLMVMCVLLAALVFRTSTNAIRALERSHERTVEHTEGLVDRLMAMDYGTYQAYKQQEKVRDEAVETAEPEPMVPTLGPDRGGFGSRLGLRALSVRASHEDTEALMEAEIPS